MEPTIPGWPTRECPQEQGAERQNRTVCFLRRSGDNNGAKAWLARYAPFRGYWSPYIITYVNIYAVKVLYLPVSIYSLSSSALGNCLTKIQLQVHQSTAHDYYPNKHHILDDRLNCLAANELLQSAFIIFVYFHEMKK